MADPEFNRVPAIIFSAFTHPDLDFNTYGCDAVIAKPFNLEDLTGNVKKFLAEA